MKSFLPLTILNLVYAFLLSLSQAEIVISNLQNDDFNRFGFALDVIPGESEDTLLVSDWGDKDKGVAAGAAYLIKVISGKWDIAQKIYASDATEYSSFGYSVDARDAYAIIGAPNKTSAIQKVTDAGGAYIFHDTGLGWVEQIALEKPGVHHNHDQFGTAVAIGANYALVAAINDDANGLDAGRVYVYQRSGNTWNWVGALDGLDDEKIVRFGDALALNKDATVAVVGNPYGYFGGAPAAGKVFVYTRQGNTWTQEAVIGAQDSEAGGFFGKSVAIAENVIAVGAPSEDNGELQDVAASGAVYIFEKLGNNWVQAKKLVPPDAQSNDNFGWSVDLRRSAFNGAMELAVGATKDDDADYDAGSVYLFRRFGGNHSWLLVEKYVAQAGDDKDYCGTDVALSDRILYGGAPDLGSPVKNEGLVYAWDIALHRILALYFEIDSAQSPLNKLFMPGHIGVAQSLLFPFVPDQSPDPLIGIYPASNVFFTLDFYADILQKPYAKAATNVWATTENEVALQWDGNGTDYDLEVAEFTSGPTIGELSIHRFTLDSQFDLSAQSDSLFFDPHWHLPIVDSQVEVAFRSEVPGEEVVTEAKIFGTLLYGALW